MEEIDLFCLLNGVLLFRLMHKLRKNHKVMDGAADEGTLQGAPERVHHLNLQEEEKRASDGEQRQTGSSDCDRHTSGEGRRGKPGYTETC